MRRDYGLTRAGVAALPWWEREALFQGSLALSGVELEAGDELEAGSDERWNLPPPPAR